MNSRALNLAAALTCTLVATSTAFAAKLSPNTSFETTDGATTPVAGEVVSATGDGPAWAGPWFAAYLPADTVYSNEHSTTGAWSMLQDTTGRDEEPEVERVFAEPMKKGQLSLRIRRNKVDRNTFGVFVSNGNPNLRNGDPAARIGRAVYVGLVPADLLNSTGGNGDLTAYDGQAEAVLADNVQAIDTWYEITIDFDCNQDVYDVYFDGEKINATPLPFFNPQTTLDRITIYTGAAQSPGPHDVAGSMHWIDDVSVTKKGK